MILLISLNPALDTTYWISRFEPGEANRVNRQMTVAGGKAVNAAKVIDSLGKEVGITGFIGGASGKNLKSLLSETSIHQKWLETSGSTRTCFNIIDEEIGIETEVLERGIEIGLKDWQDFLFLLQEIVPSYDLILISGSLPSGLNENHFTELLEHIHLLGKRVAVDTSGPALSSSVERQQPILIKPNLRELEELSGRSLNSKEAIVQEAKNLQRKGVDRVVVSLGKEGALAVTGEGAFHAAVPSIVAVNSVGSGDASFGCMALAIAEGASTVEMLMRGMAGGIANALNETAGSVRLEDYKYYLKKIQVANWSEGF